MFEQVPVWAKCLAPPLQHLVISFAATVTIKKTTESVNRMSKNSPVVPGTEVRKRQRQRGCHVHHQVVFPGSKCSAVQL